MIQVHDHAGKRFDTIANKHYNACHSYVESWLDYYINVLHEIKIGSISTATSLKRYDIAEHPKTMEMKRSLLLQKKKSKRSKIKPVFKNHAGKIEAVLSYIRKSWVRILLNGKPKELLDAEGKILAYAARQKLVWKDLKGNWIEEYKALIAFIFDYGKLTSSGFGPSKWDNYLMTQELGIRVCSYCNRQYTFTVITEAPPGLPIDDNNKIIVPELDHFFPKSLHPFFAISFYNLIPSCRTCNSLKSGKPVTLANFMHPYLEGFKNMGRFNYRPVTSGGATGSSSKLEIFIDVDKFSPDKAKIYSHVDLFKLNDIYTMHSDVVQELIGRYRGQSIRYLQLLKDNYRGLFSSFEELYQFAFGNHYDDKLHENRTMAKLTRDIIERLEQDYYKTPDMKAYYKI